MPRPSQASSLAARERHQAAKAAASSLQPPPPSPRGAPPPQEVASQPREKKRWPRGAPLPSRASRTPRQSRRSLPASGASASLALQCVWRGKGSETSREAYTKNNIKQEGEYKDLRRSVDPHPLLSLRGRSTGLRASPCLCLLLGPGIPVVDRLGARLAVARRSVVIVTLLLPLDRPDRKSTRLNSSHSGESRMPSSA